MSTTVGTMVELEDVLTEHVSGQYVEIDLVDGTGTAISTSAITAITGTLRSTDTGEAIFENTNLLASPARATYPSATSTGTVRITFRRADMVTSGTRRLQSRRLTVTISHSDDATFNCGVYFVLQALDDDVA
jgi:hypothetical protein